jgi:hypothetical protein
MGWFFGFKLHLICNEKGELLNFMITPGDVDTRHEDIGANFLLSDFRSTAGLNIRFVDHFCP